MRIYSREAYINEDSSLKKDLLRLFDRRKVLTILDIGACEGEESIRYSRLFPFSKIYAFEPLPLNQERVKNNIESYGLNNISLLPIALSDLKGEIYFYKSSGHPSHIPKNVDWDFGNKSGSLLMPNSENIPKWLEFKNRILVQSSTLELFLTDARIDIVDFIHMDVQGAELKVLKGANHFIKKIKAIWLEVADVELYKSQPLRVDIEDFMKVNGFKLVKSIMSKKVGDQFYVNKSYFYVIALFSKVFYFKKER